MRTAKILIVDDEKNILRTIAKTLADYEVKSLGTGSEALDTMKNEDFDVVILDLRLPDLDGLEVLRQLDRVGKKHQVIMITAHGTIDFAVEAMKLGCVDFIQKPFDIGLLRSTVDDILARENLSEQQNLKFDSLLQMAKYQTQQRHFQTAMETVKQAIALRPDDALAYNYLGALCEVMGRIPEAISAYQTSSMLDPANEAAKNNLLRIRNAGLMDHINLD